MQYRITIMGVLILAIFFGKGFDEKTTRKIEKSMQLTTAEASSLKMYVANINGTVEVNGYNGTEIRLKATKRINTKWGNHEQHVNEIDLVLDRKGSSIRVYLTAPFLKLKERDSDKLNYKFDYKNDDDRPYEFEFDIEISVPYNLILDASTINGSFVKVSNMQSNQVKATNINGDVELDKVAGTTHAQTINGNVDVKFTANPNHDSTFKTINGDIDVSFPDNLNAQIHFSSLHGDVFTDFENVSYGQADIKQDRDKRGNARFKVGRNAPVFIGDGGPKHSFEVINGDVFIRRIK